ncbi:hypothetical protein PUNSTDRAFT_72754 [Punctularia strigosozonata HHB-11173 SS5]|uniref:uncharacterized protein n=1 Tax=Punctularia strigosozonata (strain HHB-11173) TaxID=741275 RepID=UPI0004417953|nr:uncharacterized protein PUNSTDRAFT_72754 [Punctularia strigosozonata HHB-11173 SS5]EIN06908.1 hypothetical protein PUNSTDRAFT_72754 [Punctularia strigosozonata HHB-11173 SS5]
MKSFAIAITFLAASVSISAFPLQKLRRADVDAATIAALAPPLGFTAGLNPDGTGSCDGANGADGKPIKIPCDCPPDNATYIAALTTNVQAGHQVNNTGVLVNFPTDNSISSEQARITTALETLQNLVGPGKGCPAVSTTLQALSKSLDAQASAGASTVAAVTAAPATSAAAAPATSAATVTSAADDATATSSSGLTLEQVDQLAPDLGFSSGVNPTGTGDCDGAVNGADGKPIKIPCSCPPPRSLFIADLFANIQAGHQVNNTGVAVNFPTDDSVASQQARITASLETLQNLEGPGKGCPAVSTTLQAQSKALGRK